MSFSVIIPSKNAGNLFACVDAIRQCEPGFPSDRIIAVDDGLVGVPDGIRVVPGAKPFIFSRNCNLGIMAANPQMNIQRHKSDSVDVILLNDDALLKTPGGFTALAAVAADHPEYGVISGVTNSVGNRAQLQKDIGLREERRMVCFICAYIPRATFERVGLLDERYVDYGMDDDDYCFSVRAAGLKIGIFDGCFVDHLSLKSSFRGPAGRGGNFMPNLARFKQKWGMDNWGHPA